jgi:type IV pilus assembly protein PilX
MPTAARKSEQGGFSLITTLILLTVVMALGIGASQMVLLAERSARFDRDQQIAFQAAEAALLDAEFDIRGPNSSFNQREALFSGRLADIVSFSEGCSATSTTRGLCLPAATGVKSIWYSVDFTDETNAAKTAKFGEFTGRTLPSGDTGTRSEIAPRYIIEIIPDATAGASSSSTAPKALYRITSMGFGPRKETQAVLQMIFRKE